MRIHLDPVGGVAGDMFVAALLDAWPEHTAGALALLESLDLPARARAVPHKDHALTGTRFIVERVADVQEHAHASFRSIRDRIAGWPLGPRVRERALDVFARLARAEGQVHGIDADDVTFHEVGAWDSIADIVCACHLIEAVGARAWSVGPLPLGSGRVSTAHGSLPVPAPATAVLLEGLAVFDDGLSGERVTPTGAALLRHLEPAAGPGRDLARMGRTGLGFGTRTFPGISNVLRVVALEEAEPPLQAERVCVLRFEVDDQASEDLAVGLDRLRALEGVLDVLQNPSFSKKGRISISVQVLAREDALEATLRACFAETTTLGVRFSREERAVLERESDTWIGPEGSVRVKSATRPDGRVTLKAEVDDVADAPGGHSGREHRRRQAEDGVRREPRDE